MVRSEGLVSGVVDFQAWGESTELPTAWPVRASMTRAEGE